VTSTDSHRAIEAVFRIEQAKLIAGLARMLRDVGLAELAQDALVAASRPPVSPPQIRRLGRLDEPAHVFQCFLVLVFLIHGSSPFSLDILVSKIAKQ
jgi:hypothetical protein